MNSTKPYPGFPYEELPEEVDNEQLKKLLEQLLDLIDETKFTDSDRHVPELAYEYIGKERSIIHDKTSQIWDLTWSFLDYVPEKAKANLPEKCESKFPDSKNSHEKIARFAQLSKNPARTMDVISRIRKYLKENRSAPQGSERKGPAQMCEQLTDNLKRQGYVPPTRADEDTLIKSLRDFIAGKPVKDIVSLIDSTRNRMMRQALPASREARLIAKYQGRDRDGLFNMALQFDDMKDYFLAKVQGVISQQEKSKTQQ